MKEHLFRGEKGTYLDLVIWENKNGPDQYGNTHTICQSISKEAREAGEKGPILGNMKLEQQPPVQAIDASRNNEPQNDEDVPF